MQVLSLSQDQVNALAESERNAIMQLASRVAASFVNSVLTSDSAKSIHGCATSRNLTMKPNSSSIVHVEILFPAYYVSTFLVPSRILKLS